MRSIPVPAAVLIAVLGLSQPACNPKAPANQAVGAPSDRTTASTTSSSTQTSRDTPPTGGAKPPAEPSAGGGVKLSRVEYEGWRQYHVHCARCHGQDALPNPVAANLLLSVGPGGRTNSEQTFTDVVAVGRPASGMPGFKDLLTADQITGIYAYVKGRAEKRIPPVRPERPM